MLFSLIVVNSKLSGANSFQGYVIMHASLAAFETFTFDRTVEHCFGAAGLIAISIAQWALYAVSDLEPGQR